MNRKLTTDDLKNLLGREEILRAYFRDDFLLFVAWTFCESGCDQFAVRFEPGYKYGAGLLDCLSLGAWQIMGANARAVSPTICTPEAVEQFLRYAELQINIVAAWAARCPSDQAIDFLRWWNTGRTYATEAGEAYVARIFAKRKELAAA